MHELHYLQHGRVNHRASQINGSIMDTLTYNLVHCLPAVRHVDVKRHSSKLYMI